MTHNKRWTEEEVEFLKLNYRLLTPQQIADVLGRTVIGVKSQAHTLGFTKKKFQAVDGKKRCSKCEDLKDTTEFYKHNSSSDGFYTWCKICTKSSRKKKYFDKNIQKELDKKQAWIDQRKDQLFQCSQCKESLKIDLFNVFKRKDGSFERRNLCTPCNSKRNRQRVLNKERRNLYAEPTNRA